jgi:hypothetical protein
VMQKRLNLAVNPYLWQISLLSNISESRTFSLGNP